MGVELGQVEEEFEGFGERLRLHLGVRFLAVGFGVAF